MQDIFETNELYPYYDISFKEHFKDHFEDVMICFSPFFTMGSGDNIAVQASRVISLEELQEQDELYKKLQPTENRIIQRCISPYRGPHKHTQSGRNLQLPYTK